MLKVTHSGNQGFLTETNDGQLIERRGPNPDMPYIVGDVIAIAFKGYKEDGSLNVTDDFSEACVGCYVEDFDDTPGFVLVNVKGLYRSVITSVMIAVDKRVVINLTAYERFDKAVDAQIDKLDR